MNSLTFKLFMCLLVVYCVTAKPNNECAGTKATDYIMCDGGNGICKPVNDDIPGQGAGRMMCCPLDEIECQFYRPGR